MFNRQQYIFIGSIFFVLLLSSATAYAQTTLDSTKLLKSVTVSSNKTPVNFKAAVPVQVLNHTTLQEINAESIGDAAKYF